MISTNRELNPIENLWIVLKNAISKSCPPPKTLFDLQAVIREEWEKNLLIMDEHYNFAGQ